MTRAEAQRWRQQWAQAARALEAEARNAPLLSAAEAIQRSAELTSLAAQQLGWPLPQSAWDAQEAERRRRKA